MEVQPLLEKVRMADERNGEERKEKDSPPFKVSREKMRGESAESRGSAHPTDDPMLAIGQTCPKPANLPRVLGFQNNNKDLPKFFVW